MKREEQQIHKTVVQHLRAHGARNLLFFHVPMGGYRSPVEAAILVSLGAKAGVSDLILLHDGRFFALELKVDKGRVTPSQREFINAVKAAGGSGEIAFGLDDALEVLKMWGLLQGTIQ